MATLLRLITFPRKESTVGHPFPGDLILSGDTACNRLLDPFRRSAGVYNRSPQTDRRIESTFAWSGVTWTSHKTIIGKWSGFLDDQSASCEAHSVKVSQCEDSSNVGT
eukprot:707558_1